MRSRLKRFVLRLITEAVRRSPSVRAAVIDSLVPTTNTFKLAGRLAERHGFTGLVAEGTCGSIRGSLDDSAALLRYAHDGYWAPHEREGFEALFRKTGGTYLDLGANIGLTVIPIARNPAVDCHAFEPHPVNFRHLQENVAVNCQKGNVALHNLALFDSDVTLEFEVSSGHSGDHRIRIGQGTGQLNEQDRTTIKVQAKRLDTLLRNVRRPLGVKIDTQGAEPFVVAGGASVLADAELLSIEFWPYSMVRMGGDITKLTSFLADNFREGSATVGDKDEPPCWRPIDSLVAFLNDYSKVNLEPGQYLDVTVRK